MVAIPKDSNSCWKTDYMHVKFGNKYSQALAAPYSGKKRANN